MSETADLNDIDPVSQAWNAAYEGGKYTLDGPLPFAGEISGFVHEHLPPDARGLYVGCGNGRNFIPMVEAGLHLDGIDMSAEGISQIQQMLPAGFDGTLSQGNFHELSGQWDYLVSIQVFQHGNETESSKHFAQAARLLKPGGYMFLRVNTASTRLDLAHEIIEGEEGKSRTVRYLEGHKAEAHIPIHYFDRIELETLADQQGFTIIQPLSELATKRESPRQLTWSQWETIWQKTA